jgi:hypothetical protein
MKTSKVILIICVISASFAAWLYLKPQTQSRQVTQGKTDEPPYAQTTELPRFQKPTKPQQLFSSQVAAFSSPPKAEPWNGKAGYEVVERWRESRGYMSAADQEIYDNYNDETIKQLAESGDIKAIRTLAKIYVRDRADPDLVIATLRQASVRGSTESLILEGMMTKTPRHFPQFSGSDGDELYKKDMMEALAIFKAAQLRGDREADSHITQTRSEVKLTPNDDAHINLRAQEIYKELEDNRKALGLGPFDNNVPSQVNDYFDAAANGFPTN